MGRFLGPILGTEGPKGVVDEANGSQKRHPAVHLDARRVLGRPKHSLSRKLNCFGVFFSDHFAYISMFSSPELSKAPFGCIWIDQIREPLTWFTSFWNYHGTENIVRIFSIDAHFNRGRRVWKSKPAAPGLLKRCRDVDFQIKRMLNKL